MWFLSGVRATIAFIDASWIKTRQVAARARPSARNPTRAYAVPTEHGCADNTSVARIAQTPLQPLKLTIVGRHREKMVRKTRSLQAFELSKAFVLVGRDHDHGRLTVLRYGLRLARAASTTSLNRFLASCTDHVGRPMAISSI